MFCIYEGDGAFQADDDHKIIYGGLVYLYNDAFVEVTAPCKGNDHAIGTIINTGQANSFRNGSNHDTNSEALVRVKVWVAGDLPSPDFQSDWVQIDTQKNDEVFKEIAHNVGKYPALVNVQIKSKASNTFMVSEGVGSGVSEHMREYENTGGIVWAYNDQIVRIWAGYETMDRYQYGIFGLIDGWHNILHGVNILKGEARVIAWSQENLKCRSYSIRHQKEWTFTLSDWDTFKPIDMDHDIVQLYVEALDGPNLGFRFPGYGSSQAKTTPFGGLVFAYNQHGAFRTWLPNPENGGFLVFVKEPYGNGSYVQASNNAQAVAILVKG